MTRRAVVSTTIESIGYDRTTAILEVEFVGGAVYEHFMVPQSVYEGFLAAASKGRFYGEYVKSKYRFQRC